MTSIRYAIAGLTVLAGCEGMDQLPDTNAVTSAASAITGESADGNVGSVARCPDGLPQALNPPADTTLLPVLGAKGVQIYVCATPAAGGDPVFTLKAPHAVLAQGGEMAAIHFAGPTWQALDGSQVVGARLASAPSPDPTAIAWLLLQATPTGAPGLFADVTTIQRLNTEGGLAPATGCDAAHLGAQVLVPYRADYFFYHPAAGASRVKQCRSSTL
jgi:hypothetical protein